MKCKSRLKSENVALVFFLHILHLPSRTVFVCLFVAVYFVCFCMMRYDVQHLNSHEMSNILGLIGAHYELACMVFYLYYMVPLLYPMILRVGQLLICY